MNNTTTHTTPIVAFASGKGGVGKTGLCLNFAHSLARMGKKVLVFDGDLGLANVDVQLAITPQKDLSDVLSGAATLADATTLAAPNLWVIPGRSAAGNLPFLNALERHNVLKDLRNLAENYDIVLLDIAAGVNDEVLSLAHFADRVALVTTPDPSSITDAYAMIKLMKNRYHKTHIEVLINQAGGMAEGKQTYTKLNTAAENFLKISLPLLGIIPYDRQYASAVKLQQIAAVAFPSGKVCNAIKEVAPSLLR